MVKALGSHLQGFPSGTKAATLGPSKSSQGFILIFVLLMLMGIGALAAAMVFNGHKAQVSAQNHKNRIKAFYASDGVRALLAQEVIDGNAKVYIDTGMAGEINGEVWNGAGGSLGALRSAMSGPPSSKEKSQYLGSNWKFRQNYGVRWRGYIIPPSSGAYTFLVRADDEGAFYLSTDERPSNLSSSPIALVESYAFAWPMFGNGISSPVSLKIGKRYYFEFLHVQDGGAGFGQVGWRGPNYMTERPIPGKRLAAYGSKADIWDTTWVGKGRVKYSLKEAGPLVYTLNTEAFMGGKGDTNYRAPLNQTLSMRGDNPAPPESLWQRVIFYDYRADGSSPDFERGNPDFEYGTPTTGMVRNKGLKYTTVNAKWFGMDSIGKPMAATPKWNCGVTQWFTPWEPGRFMTYNYAGGQTDCTESPSGSDRAFENRVIKDSLLFIRRSDLGVNAYQFKDYGASGVMAFDPLANRGFGNEGRAHNYSFCMEIHTLFEHTSGMNFEFNGDDDVWLYINDSLVMDLGFVHPSAYATVALDDQPLKFGETYPLAFFFCERRTPGSSIDLITNLPVLQITGKPASTWKREYGNTE